MTKLIDIITTDLSNVGRIARGFVRGSVRGVYTPALLCTGIKQAGNETEKQQTIGEAVSALLGQIGTASAIHVPLAMYAVSQGKGTIYFSTLAVTNSLDYLANAYRRSR